MGSVLMCILLLFIYVEDILIETKLSLPVQLGAELLLQCREIGSDPGIGFSIGRLMIDGLRSIRGLAKTATHHAQIHRYGRALVPNIKLFGKLHRKMHQVGLALVQVGPLNPGKTMLSNHNIFNCKMNRNKKVEQTSTRLLEQITG